MNHRLSHGFSLIEVLVTIVVLAIGLLGLAGLQTAGLRNNQSALLRSNATMLAYDIVDRMRANKTTALNGGYDIGLNDSAPGGTAMNAVDLQQWKAALAQMLPAGRGSVVRVFDALNNITTITVQIEWDDSRGVDPPQQFVFDTQL